MKKFTGLSLESYLNELSSETPVPGGGSVSAYTAALGMGLIQMVGRVSLNRKKKQGLTPEEDKKDESRRSEIRQIVDAVEKAKRDAFQIVNTDPAAYDKVMKAYGQAPEIMEAALKESFQMQADLGFLIALAKGWNHKMKQLVSGSIKNDLIVSGALLEAAFQGAYHTAEINVVYMKDPSAKQNSEATLKNLKERYAKG